MFPLTAWSRIVAVQARDEGSREALEEVCRRYWHPARKFLRSLGCGEQDAEDVTQRFFARWARPESFERLDPARGRLRSYLKQALRREFINHWRQRAARPAEKDAVSTEVVAEPCVDSAEAEDIYDAAWAEAVVAAVLRQLRAEYGARGRDRAFEAAVPAVFGTDGLKPHAESAVSAGMTEPQFKLEVHRLRRRFAARLRDEVAGTLTDPAEVDDELRHLVRVMARHGRLTDVL